MNGKSKSPRKVCFRTTIRAVFCSVFLLVALSFCKYQLGYTFAPLLQRGGAAEANKPFAVSLAGQLQPRVGYGKKKLSPQGGITSTAATGLAITLAGLQAAQEEHEKNGSSSQHLRQLARSVPDTAVNTCTGQGMDSSCLVSGVVTISSGRIEILVETGKLLHAWVLPTHIASTHCSVAIRTPELRGRRPPNHP